MYRLDCVSTVYVNSVLLKKKKKKVVIDLSHVTACRNNQKKFSKIQLINLSIPFITNSYIGK